jgi:LytTr DNA-binding domain-containing protein
LRGALECNTRQSLTRPSAPSTPRKTFGQKAGVATSIVAEWRMRRNRIAQVSAALLTIVLLSAQEYATRHWRGGPRSFQSMLWAQCIGAGVWLALLPVMAVARRAIALAAESQLLRLGLHAVAAFCVALLQTAILAVLYASYYYGWSPLAYYDVFRDRMHTWFLWSAAIYPLLMVTVFPTPAVEAVEKTGPDVGTNRFARRIIVKHDGKMGVVPVEDVDWIEAADNYVVVHTRVARHIVRTSLSRLAERLDPTAFVRVHRSTVVNVDRVREVQPWFQGDLVLILKDDTRLNIGRKYRDEFLRTLEG